MSWHVVMFCKMSEFDHYQLEILKLSIMICTHGFGKVKKKKNTDITAEVGCWVQVSPGHFAGISSHNSPIPVIILWGIIPCVF